MAAEVDPGQLNQVIGNLIINANQAMPNGGTITIRTKNVEIDSESDLPLPSGRYIRIEVEDQGIGISKKHILNIFEPYYTTKQKEVVSVWRLLIQLLKSIVDTLLCIPN